MFSDGKFWTKNEKLQKCGWYRIIQSGRPYLCLLDIMLYFILSLHDILLDIIPEFILALHDILLDIMLDFILVFA
jgi:hypothetical protein